jgi:hypothetical protein
MSLVSFMGLIQADGVVIYSVLHLKQHDQLYQKLSRNPQVDNEHIRITFQHASDMMRQIDKRIHCTTSLAKTNWFEMRFGVTACNKPT